MYERFGKRVLDFLLALVLSLLLSPVLVVLTVTGAIAMGGNPFFTQPRPGKIGSDGKEKIFLQYHRDCRAKRIYIVLSYVNSAYLNTAFGNVIKTGEQVYQSGFACAGLSYDTHRFSCRDFKGNMVDNNTVFFIREHHVVKLNVPLYIGKRNGIFRFPQPRTQEAFYLLYR